MSRRRTVRESDPRPSFCSHAGVSCRLILLGVFNQLLSAAGRSPVTECAGRSTLVVKPPPVLDQHARFAQVSEPLGAQALIAQLPIENSTELTAQ
jgi:hypothetical protein